MPKLKVLGLVLMGCLCNATANQIIITCSYSQKTDIIAKVYIKRVNLFTEQLDYYVLNAEAQKVLKSNEKFLTNSNYISSRYYQKYIVQKQPLSKIIKEWGLKLWLVNGNHLSWRGVNYKCIVNQ